MEKYLLKFGLNLAVGLTLLISSSCSKTEVAADKPAMDEVASWGTVQEKAGGEFSGTGGLRFLKTLPTAQMSVGIEMEVYLENQDSSVELVMFAKDPNLSDGVHLAFSRSTSNKVVGTVNLNNTGAKSILSSRMDNFLLTPLSMAVDIHGQGTMARVMVYRAEAATGDPYFFDTKRAGDLTDGALGTSSLAEGIHGGILMTNARVHKAQRRDPVTPRESAL